MSDPRQRFRIPVILFATVAGAFLMWFAFTEIRARRVDRCATEFQRKLELAGPEYSMVRIRPLRGQGMIVIKGSVASTSALDRVQQMFQDSPVTVNVAVTVTNP